MVPNIWTISALAPESYLILIAWSVMGFVFFRYVFSRDTERRFGKSTVVWIVLLFLIFFSSMLWLRQSTYQVTEKVLEELSKYNIEELAEHGVELDAQEKAEAENYLESQINYVNNSLARDSFTQMVLIMLALFIMFSIYRSMIANERKMETEKLEAERNNLAKSTFLSNMSHDIRTPMNAIIGYTNLAMKEKDVPPKLTDFLGKIEASSQHLLALINDVLDMSRIESGKMELEIEPSD
ncbi:MAG: hypothetical protein IJU50_09080, partial [Lachnospiraceae bacterium]|nr:hypothetical protein [Lachnospiraceae bacterium]